MIQIEEDNQLEIRSRLGQAADIVSDIISWVEFYSQWTFFGNMKLKDRKGGSDRHAEITEAIGSAVKIVVAHVGIGPRDGQNTELSIFDHV